MKSRPVAVVETTMFSSWADRYLTESERERLTFAVASDPKVGDVIPGLHGLRKLRWRRPGSGKRGGYRVIYFFLSDRAPIFLMAGYSKSAQEDLSPDEKRKLSRMALDIKYSLSD